jgi:hypothetical protein
MARLLFVLLCMMLALSAPAQQKTQEEQDREKRFQEESAKANKDTSSFRGWKHTAAAGLNLSQVSYKDWVAGGENALAYGLHLGGLSTSFADRTVWANTYRFAFGQARLGDQGLRKTDDEVYMESFLVYKLGTQVNPYAAGTFRTQFAPGNTYDGGGVETQVSKFFDPAYLTQSAGVAYQPVAGVTTRVGIALREVLTSNFPAYADDPDTKDIVEKTSVRGGAESVTDLHVTLADNIDLTARLELFAPFNAMGRVIVRNDYGIAAKVNSFISTTLTVNILNDVNISPRTQIKQVLALGLTYTLL